MTSRLLIFSLLLFSAFLLAACGGGSAGNGDARLVDQYGLSLDVIEGGGADYALDVQQAETVLVDVRVENAVDMVRTYVELNYDAELITPLRIMDGGFLGADTLFLQVTDRPHRVPVCVARTGENPEGVSGRGIVARIEFARGAHPRRGLMSCPGKADIIGCDLDQDANTITVNWTDDNGGDTNKDRHLNGLDVFPIATRFGAGQGDGNYDACADSNSDGTINGLDVFPIAAKFDQRLDGYNVYWDVSPDMEEAFVPENGSPIPVDYAGSCRGDYQFTLGPLPDDSEYYVGITVLDDAAGEEGDFCVSEPLVLGTPNYFKPAVNFWGENYGDYVYLDWEKPETPERVYGYHVFRKPETGGSYEDITGKISATDYEDHGLEDAETGNYLYHVVVEYDGAVMSDPTSDISIYWEKTNLPPVIIDTLTSNITLGRNDVRDATLSVLCHDGEGGDDVEITWEVIQGSGTFPGGNTGAMVEYNHASSGTPEKVVVKVTVDDGGYQVTDTIRLVYTTLNRIRIGTSGPADGHFVDYTMDDMKNGGTVNFADDIFSQNCVLLMNFWASW